MPQARVTLGGLLVACLLAPRPAAAQPESWLHAVRELASAATRPEPGRTADLRSAVARMTTALTAWDQNIRQLEQRTAIELREAPPTRRVQAHVELGVAYLTRGHPADALREFDAAAALYPSSADLQQLRAMAIEAVDGTAAARPAYRAAWTLDAANPVLAYEALRRGALTESDQARARAVLAQAYTALLSTRDAPAVPPFLVLDGLPDALSGTAILADDDLAEAFGLLTAGEYDAAIAGLTRAPATRRSTGGSPLEHFHRARALEADNRVADARREYRAALPGVLAGRSLIDVAIGRLALVDGDADEAIAAFTEAVRLNPNDPQTHLELGNAHAAYGRTDEAFAEFVAALLIAPGHAPAHAAIGQLWLDTGRPADAVTAFERALVLNPAGYEVRYGLATALARMGRAADAAREREAFDRIRRTLLDRRRQGIQGQVDGGDTVRPGHP